MTVAPTNRSGWQAIIHARAGSKAPASTRLRFIAPGLWLLVIVLEMVAILWLPPPFAGIGGRQ